jgi:hypothetical protein
MDKINVQFQFPQKTFGKKNRIFFPYMKEKLGAIFSVISSAICRQYGRRTLSAKWRRFLNLYGWKPNRSQIEAQWKPKWKPK